MMAVSRRASKSVPAHTDSNFRSESIGGDRDGLLRDDRRTHLVERIDDQNLLVLEVPTELLEAAVLTVCILRRDRLARAPVRPVQRVLDVRADVLASQRRGRRLDRWVLRLEEGDEVSDVATVGVDGALGLVDPAKLGLEVLEELVDVVQALSHARILPGKFLGV